MFHRFFSSPTRSWSWSILSLSFFFYSIVHWNGKIQSMTRCCSSSSYYYYYHYCCCSNYYFSLVMFIYSRGCPRGVIVKVLDYRIVVSEFGLQLHYYVHFRINTLGERYESPYPSSNGLNSITAVLIEGLVDVQLNNKLVYTLISARVQNLDEGVCVSLRTNALWNGMNQSVLPSTIGK